MENWMKPITAIGIAAVSMFLVFSAPAVEAGQDGYSLVISGGRVIDPETGTDQQLNVGVKDDRIVALTADKLQGQAEIDASGLVVAPGFIDLNNHAFTELSLNLMISDGVTTRLQLESGVFPISDFGLMFEAFATSNYGATVSYSRSRRHALEAIGYSGKGSDATDQAAGPEKLYPVIRQTLLEQLDAGALGIGLPLDYISKLVSNDELHVLFEVAGQRQAPVFVHVRRGVNGDPTGLREVLDLSLKFNAPLHICHITHSGMRNTDLFLREIAETRSKGVNVTTEILPYNAGSTSIGAAVFGRNWQEIFGITYADVQWAATGEYFTSLEQFEQYRRDNPRGGEIHHYVKEEWNRRAIVEPGVMVVSDAVRIQSLDKKAPPHIGAFARVLGKYVREEGLITLEDAISRMTYLPALRLQDFAPAFSRKGRLQVGADADITIFDPERVIDKATYEEPFERSEGIDYVIVNGVVVVRHGELEPDVYPGKIVLSGD
jgi:hypothetical protein